MNAIKEYEIKQVLTEDILIDGENPNEMSPAEAERLKDSMKEFGNTQPIVVDEKTMLVADGEHRLKTYLAAGKKTIPAILLPFKDDAHRRAYRQAANKIRGTHDPVRDAVELLKIVEAGRKDLLKMATGMNMTQVDRHIRKYNPQDQDITLTEDNFPLSKDHKPKYDIKPGDVYQLGPHTLICGDSTKPETTNKLMQGKKTDLHWIDPPYNLTFTGTEGKFEEMANDKLNDKEYKNFINELIKQIKNTAAQHATLYICIDYRSYPVWAEALNQNQIDIMNVIVWDKVYAGLGNRYRFRHEFIIYAGNKAFTHWYGDMIQEDVIKIQATQTGQEQHMLDRSGYAIPLQNGSYLRLKIEDKPPKRIKILEGETHTFKTENQTNTNIWEGFSMNYFQQRDKEESEGIQHPTMKPLRLIGQTIKNSTKQGETVVDLCAGSGSTLIACEQTNRKCRAAEINPTYCSIIVERWEKYTNQKAQKVKQ